MATSGTGTFTVTTGQVIDGALRKIRVLPSGGTATTNQFSDALQALNIMAQAWRPKGLKSWSRNSQTVTLVADQASYTIGPGGNVDIPRPIRVADGYVTTSDSQDVPLNIISKEEYYELSSKAAEGVPNQLYIDAQAPLMVVYTWPIIGVTGYTMTLDLLKKTQDFSVTGNTPDYPSEWFEALVYNLAIRLGPEFGKTVSQEVKEVAGSSLLIAESADFQPTSVTFVMGRQYA